MTRVSKVAWIAAFGVLGMGCPGPETGDAGPGRVDTGGAVDTGAGPIDSGMRPADTGVRPNDTGTPPIDTGMMMPDAGTDAFVACTATQYRNAMGVCTALTTCTAMQYESTAPTASSDRVCMPLTVCSATQYESTAATATSNRVCSDLTVCSATQYESTAATATSNRVCSDLTVCSATQYESTAATATSNRVCSDLTDCTAGQFVATAATATSNRVCAPCMMGTFSTTTNAGMCAPWAAACSPTQFESTTPSATMDRVCTALADCAAGQFVATAPTATTNRICAPCAAMTFSTTTNAATCAPWAVCTAPSVVRRAGTASSNVVCSPVNDTVAGAVTINMAVPASTLTVDTSAAVNDTNSGGSCSCTNGNDVFYNFTIPAGASEIIYADTFGSPFDTSLFVQTSAGVTVTAPTLSNGLACSDDTMLSGCTNPTTRQSQIMLQLAPGSYRLVLSGCGAGGAATIHFQHLPVGNGPVASLAAGASTPAGTTAGTGRFAQSCGGAMSAPENTYYWYTCDGSTGGAFSASTCSLATWDTVVEQRSALRAMNACNDDFGGMCGTRSTVNSTIPAGAGIHTLYVDGFNGASGAYSVAVSRP